LAPSRIDASLFNELTLLDQESAVGAIRTCFLKDVCSSGRALLRMPINYCCLLGADNLLGLPKRYTVCLVVDGPRTTGAEVRSPSLGVAEEMLLPEVASVSWGCRRDCCLYLLGLPKRYCCLHLLGLPKRCCCLWVSVSWGCRRDCYLYLLGLPKRYCCGLRTSLGVAEEILWPAMTSACRRSANNGCRSSLYISWGCRRDILLSEAVRLLGCRRDCLPPSLGVAEEMRVTCRLVPVALLSPFL
jgi:hypothetical protein